MTDPVQIPSYVDLMYPTLRALVELGDQSDHATIDEKVIELTGITSEQLAVEFPESSVQHGSKVKHRLAWARSYLKKLGAVETREKGIWAVTEDGKRYLELEDGEGVLRHREHELRVGRKPDLFLKHLVERIQSEGEYKTSVRDLIAEWQVKRRGNAVVTRILRDLGETGLVVRPSIDQVALDDTVTIVLAPSGIPSDPASSDAISNTVTIGTLPSAGGGIASVPPDAPILEAQSIMESRDFSQLAVTEGDYVLKGAISWESIARSMLYSGSAPKTVREGMEPDAVTVFDDEPLLDHVATIAEAGYVFVRERSSNRLKGIVTSADLSHQFARLANPFLLIGEIERWLRLAVDSVFTPDELAAFVDPSDPDRQIEAAQSLTFGEYVRLFEDPESWARFGWRADRKVFTRHLDDVRVIRNSIMHFSPDPIEPAEMERIQQLLIWVRRLVQRSSDQI